VDSYLSNPDSPAFGYGFQALIGILRTFPSNISLPNQKGARNPYFNALIGSGFSFLQYGAYAHINQL